MELNFDINNLTYTIKRDSDGSYEYIYKDTNSNQLFVIKYDNKDSLYESSLYIDNGDGELGEDDLLSIKDIFSNGLLSETNKYDIDTTNSLADGTLAEKDIYDSTGQIIVGKNFFTNGYLSEKEIYDSTTGNKTEEDFYNFNRKLTKKNVFIDGIQTKAEIYDATSGKLSEQDKYDSTGTSISEKNVYTYYSNGKVSQIDKYDNNENKVETDIYDIYGKNITRIDKYTYDSDSGNLSQIDKYSKNIKISTDIYDNSGKSIAQTLTYDSKGSSVTETDVFTYDSSGKKSKAEIYDSAGNKTGINEYIYDTTSGNLYQIDKYDSTGKKIIETDKYDSTGTKIAEKTLFTYSTSGNLLETNKYNASGKISETVIYDPEKDEKVIIETDKYTYDSTSGKLSQKDICDPNGNIIGKEKYTYTNGKLSEIDKYTVSDTNEILSQRDLYNTAGSIIESDKYTYDTTSGNLCRLDKYDGSGKLSEVDKYDSTGKNIINIDKYDSNEDLLSSNVMQYDGDGNLTNSNTYDASGNLTSEVSMTYIDKILRSKVIKDGNGKNIEKDFYYNDGTTLKGKYLYDSSTGKVIEKDLYDTSGKLTEVDYYSSGKLFEVNKFSNGIKTEKNKYDIDGNLTYTATYYANGKTIKQETLFGANDNSTGKNIITYDSYGKTVKKEMYDENGVLFEKHSYNCLTGSLKQKSIYTYNEDGTVTIFNKNANNDVISTCIQTFYDNKTIKSAQTKDSKGIIIQDDVYETDGSKTSSFYNTHLSTVDKKVLSLVSHYDVNGQLIAKDYYYSDGSFAKTINY